MNSIPYFKNSVLLILSVALVMGLNSCTSMKPGAVKGGKNLFETFYVGEGGTQYFIKPLDFIADNSEDLMSIDFTFRYLNEVRDSALVNFSIEGQTVLKKIDLIRFTNSSVKIQSASPTLLFNERRKKSFVSRFFLKIPLEEIKQLYSSDDWSIITETESTQTIFTPVKKTRKAIPTLNDNIFILM